MNLVLHITVFIFFWLHLPLLLADNSNTATATITAKPGCQSTWGNLTVPYPFGIGVNVSCSLNPSFNINCDTFSDPPKAFLGTTDLEVTAIFDNKIWVKNSLASVCYDKDGNAPTDNLVSISLINTSFSPSTENQLTVIGACNMQQKACILLILWLPFSFSISKQTINNSTIALPGCPTKCGNISVPYPFGIGLDAGCSIGPWYDINCSKSFNPPKPFLSRTNGEIIDISETKIRVKSNGIAYRCYNQTGGITRECPTVYGIDETSPFNFSNENKFIVVGCDDVSYMAKVATDNLISSCAAICSKNSDLSDGSCSGIGCCQNSIPKGLKNYINFLNSYGNHTKVSSFNRCGYSFLGEQCRYRFHPSDVSDSNFEHRIVETVPMVFDWVIGNQTCAEAQKSSLFACQENSICVDSDTGLGGYHCDCSKGYKGNPYLRPGCQG
ncbi:wall-associated receptor kinase 2-like [Olea europaea subsp. europaea]|uniref:Wall-associated receptor kinase 2-like n=1 Tax=Olea europaea subsp. europaea TaxID=158383 RepID=A0A8S0RSG4_OLEEU|nr:wall-associated receptor kinase 2-like [Olea europaea subsp. europaea]